MPLSIRRSWAGSILLCVCVSAAAHAAGFPPALFGGLRWRSIGPFRGGRALAATGVPGDPLRWYFGAVDGGVWETGDAGRTWRPIFDREPAASIGAIAVAPSDPRVIYVGTGEADMRSDIVQGDGVYKSTDGGRTWTHLGLDDTRQIAAILVDPHDANVVYVAALGHPYGPNAERGVFKSIDGGATWRKVLYRGPDTGAVDLAFEPGDSRVVYAALWQTRRPPWNVYPPSSGPGGGLFVSDDAGAHWRRLRDGLPARTGRIGIATSPADPRRVYALVDAADGGLYRSDDGGAHWARASADPRIWQRGWYFGGVTVDPTNADRVWVMNTIVLRSDDGGRVFLPEKGDPTGDDFHQLWIDPGAPRRRILASDQGVVITLNGGKTWSSWYNQPTAQIYHVATDDAFPYDVFGAQQDSGAVMLPSRTISSDGIAMPEFREIVPGGENGMIAPDPRDPDLVYGGHVDRLDRRTGQTRSVDPTLAHPGIDRATWTLPLVFSPKDPRRLYFANQRLYETRDGGLHWTRISPDLTRPDPAVPPNLDPPTLADNLGRGPRRGVIYSVAPSRVDAAQIWAGTDDGWLWRSDDDGAHWRNVTPPGVTAWSKIASIDASHFDGRTAYVAVDRHRLDDDRPYVYRTHDGGKTWTRIVAGIPPDDFVNVVREDDRHAGLLYAGTESGVYVSFDDGDHWQPLTQNLPVTSVRDLVVKNDDLVIATHGRGFWIMDDVTPLRQMATAVAARGAYLFAPALAYRVRPEGFTGTPLPMSEPRGTNPPDGAFIDYTLPTAAKMVTLTISDAAGHLVRRYRSTDKVPVTDLAAIQIAPGWIVPPIALATAPGLHRFVWNLRCAAPAPLAGDEGSWSDGVWAPPGDYRITLDVDGRVLTQTLKVVPDPRMRGMTAADYAAQFALAQRIEADRAAVAMALKQDETLHAALLARAAAVSALKTALLDYDGHLRALSDLPMHADPRNSMGAPISHEDSLRALEHRLDALDAAVDGADVAPTPDARSGYALAHAALGATLTHWRTLTGQPLQAINRKLAAAGQPPLAL